jgi:Fe-S cluster assembly protein SufD
MGKPSTTTRPSTTSPPTARATDGSGHGIFNGRIFVRQLAQRTAAEQMNRNLILSADARIDTKPQLEIFADDVRCTHGATIGQLDREELFYLMSRAIPRETARRLVIQGFADEVFERTDDERIAALLSERFTAHMMG